jgi:hypothetical protein
MAAKNQRLAQTTVVAPPQFAESGDLEQDDDHQTDL